MFDYSKYIRLVENLTIPDFKFESWKKLLLQENSIKSFNDYGCLKITEALFQNVIDDQSSVNVKCSSSKNLACRDEAYYKKFLNGTCKVNVKTAEIKEVKGIPKGFFYDQKTGEQCTMKLAEFHDSISKNKKLELNHETLEDIKSK